MSRIYIGHLSYRATERDVERFFKNYGRLKDVLLKNGYGFVEFDDYRDADDAVDDLNGKELCGDRVVVEHARMDPGRRSNSRKRREVRERDRSSRYGPPVRTENRVIVENLSSRISWQDLKDLMRKAGDVTFADAHKQHRNEGVVEFSSYSDMKAAMDRYDGYDLYGRRLKVREEGGRSSRRRRSPSRSRSRSRSLSRSRRRRSRTRSRSRSRRSARKSRSKSHSRRRTKSRSASKERRSKSRSRSRSRSKSEIKDNNSKSRSRSKSHEDMDNGNDQDQDDKAKSRSQSKSRSRSGSRSHSNAEDRRSPSRSIEENGGSDPERSPKDDGDD